MTTPGPLIVETVMARDVATLRALRDAAVSADLIELRLDGLDRVDVPAALAGRKQPIIATCRAAWEGGQFQGTEADRVRILEQALTLGAEFVDIEWRAAEAAHLITDATRHRIVLSMHDFETTPPDLADRVKAMRRLRTGVVKAAVRTTRLADLRPLLDVARAAAPADRSVFIGMGAAGVPSRALPAHFGSCWTYGGPAVAPGQLPVSRLLDEFHVRTTTARTPVYAVVGHPIEHSVSPAMHNAAFASLDIAGVYVPCDAADFDDFLGLADVLPIAGASVTAPFKEAAWQAQRGSRETADATDARGAARGALNTLRRVPNGTWEGLNTDVDGFLAPLADLDLAGRRAAVLGAGGAARAVVAGLQRRGVSIALHARRVQAAIDLAQELGVDAGSWPPEAGRWDLLVNTTPVGTFPAVDDSPMAGQALTGDLVYDLVYNPRPTRLLRDAQRAGLRTIDGIEMLVQQARRQFAWWTGTMPAADVMREAAERRLAAMTFERALSVPSPRMRGEG